MIGTIAVEQYTWCDYATLNQEICLAKISLHSIGQSAETATDVQVMPGKRDNTFEESTVGSETSEMTLSPNKRPSNLEEGRRYD